MENLDDPSKTCIYLSPGQPEDVTLPDTEEDNTYILRMLAYRAAWKKCLDRVRTIFHTLYTPIVNEVTQQVIRAYYNILPGLPYAELPVIALSGTNSALLSGIIHRLDSTKEEDDFSDGPVLQVHLYPAECSSVMNMMKAIITGFSDRTIGSKRKPTSLASFDINLLRAWHDAQSSKPTLTIFLHEFERYETSVVQDVFYICSLHVPHLPLVFIAIMSSPPTPSFLHVTYPRSTLALLRVDQIIAPTGLTVVREVLKKTFFEPNFEPDIVLGPGVLEHIIDFASRHSASPDALVTILQLAHMKHFSQPLSVLVHDELLGNTTIHDAELALESSSAFIPLVDALNARLLTASEAQSRTKIEGLSRSAQELFSYVSDARVAFRKQAQRLRVAFSIARIAEGVTSGESPHNTTHGKNAEGRTIRLDDLESLAAVLRGRMNSRVRYVCTAARKLPAAKLRVLLSKLYSFVCGLQRDEEDTRNWISEMLNQFPDGPTEANVQGDDLLVQQDARTKELAGNVGDWLQEYIESRLVRLEESTLWDIWYTGTVPFPSELINPAPRPTVVHALLHPHDFIQAHADLARAHPRSVGERVPEELDIGRLQEREPALWELPDTSIAFRRYLEAGRLVNVFDWFESFAVVLENQRQHLKRRAAGVAVNGKGKGRAYGAGDSRNGGETDLDVDMDEEEEIDEEEEERWKVEVQARFIRALHELDYMGFVKHTGRKPDHVIRTTYDVPD